MSYISETYLQNQHIHSYGPRFSILLKALFTRKGPRTAAQDPPPPPPHEEQGIEGDRKETERLANAIASPIDMDQLFKQAQVDRSPSRDS